MPQGFTVRRRIVVDATGVGELVLNVVRIVTRHVFEVSPSGEIEKAVRQYEI